MHNTPSKKRSIKVASHKKSSAKATKRGNKDESSLKEFAERCTIAGVDDAYKASGKARLYWICVIVISFALMVYVSSAVYRRFMGQKKIFDDTQIVGELAPFPNVTICVPIFFDKNKLKKALVITEKIRQRIKKAGLTVVEVIDYIKSGSAFLVTKKTDDQALITMAIKVLDDTVKTVSRNPFDGTVTPQCSQIISNCAFYGRKFDCCAAVQGLAIDHGGCLQINTQQIPPTSNTPEIQGGPSDDPKAIADSGLTIDVHFDSSHVQFEDELATNGFIVHIGVMPTPLSSPVVIPSDADALITLAPPVRITELNGCLRKDRLPALKYYDYYDQDAVNCYADLVQNNTVFELGCTMPLLSYVPDNESSCDGGRVRILMELVGGQLEDSLKEAADKVKELRDKSRKIFYGDSCPLHCSRWSYPVWMASYGYMQYRQANRGRVSENITNWSMSRIRVFFPSASYRRYTEEPVNLAYLCFCEMGGVWGVYLGVSGVTFLQVVAYSFSIARKKCARKNRKVAPA